MRWQARQGLARQWSLFQEQAPLILAPVCLKPPFAPGDDIREPDSPAKVGSGEDWYRKPV
jgi:amidase